MSRANVLLAAWRSEQAGLDMSPGGYVRVRQAEVAEHELRAFDNSAALQAGGIGADDDLLDDGDLGDMY